MNNLQNTFYFNQHELTVLTKEDGSIWFIAKEACDILNHSNVSMAMNMLDDDEKAALNFAYSGKQKRSINIVSESGVYTLAIRSNKPEAKAFRKWITSEVLPKIRKTGKYEVVEKSPAEKMAEALILAHEVIESSKPKIEFYDRVAVSNSTHSMSEVAKVLKLSYGRNKLYRELRDMGVLMRNNEPYQQYIDRGYFKVKLSEYQRGDETYTSTTTIVTGSGLEWLAKKLEVN